MVSIVMPIMLRLQFSQNKKGPNGRLTPFCVAVQQARKQKCSMSFHPPPLARLALAAALAATPGLALAQSSDMTTPWSPGANSRARLVAAGGLAPLENGRVYLAGLEIELSGGAHTYWRQPGDAGVPPTISYAGSRNLKHAELRFPAPMRIDEAGLQVLGYRQSLVLPIEITPEDPAAPVHLEVAFSYAACEKICTPAEARGALDLSPKAAPGPEAERLGAAEAALPRRVDNGAAGLQVSATPVANHDKPAWRLKIDRPAGPWRDVFAEGPDGWFFETQPADGGFDLVADERPSDAKAPPRVRLTLSGPADYETTIELPPP